MPKLFFILFVLFFCGSVVKAEKSENKTNITNNMTSDDDEDESASILFIPKDTVTNEVNNSSLKHDEKSPAEENSTEILINTNSRHAEAKYDDFFEEIISDSAEILLETQDDKNEEVSMSTERTIEESAEKLDSVLDESTEKLDTVLEKSIEKPETVEESTKLYTRDETTQEDSTIVDEDENVWRSAEHSKSGDKNTANETASEENVEDEKHFSAEDYMDETDLELKERTDARHSEISEHFDSRRKHSGYYQQSEEHGSDVVSSLGEMMIPHYRPVLTRSGIIYTQALYPLQPRLSLLDRLTRNWGLTNSKIQTIRPRHNRVIGVRYEDKLVDDYNDYGPGLDTNTYTYTPAKKVTTVAPPQQIAAPNKFDVFQKLLEASNHPLSKLKTFDEVPAQHRRSLGNFNVRRFRNAWDDENTHTKENI